jgi:class 3 adenylate cyclase
MAKVSAIILIYDIRGFTAASKKLPAGELGRFATAAHKSILELFAAFPPTFVKNLGDGHLLIWETEDDPDKALVQSIVETATKARAVFPAFVAGHLNAPENAGQKLPTQVGIGVVVGEVSKSDDYYGVAVNLAARLQNMSRPEGLAMDEKTFAMAGDREELIRRGFRKAKVSLKGLGNTRVWVDRPFSWARLGWALMPYFIAVLIPVLYVLLADAEVRYIPWGVEIREWLDHHEITLFRRAMPLEQIQAAADADRRAIAAALLNARIKKNGMIAVNLGEVTEESDVWGTSQAITGLLKTPHLDVATRRELISVFDNLFKPGTFIEGYGWLAHFDDDYTEAEPALWTVAALACALGSPGVLEGDRRTQFEQYLEKAQTAVMIYRPRDTGAWNIFPNQKNLDYYSPYSTALALLALLEVRAAGLPWQGSIEKRDALLKSTAEFLIGLFEEKQGERGWRRTAEKAEPVSEGLTLQIYAELLRAEAEAGIQLPAQIIAEIPRRIKSLERRDTKDNLYDMGEFRVVFTTHDNREKRGTEGINFLWHPWAIDAAMRWLERAKRVPTPPENVRGVYRTLAVLAVDMSEKKREEATKAFSFVGGEGVYGLSAIPAPSTAPAK